MLDSKEGILVEVEEFLKNSEARTEGVVKASFKEVRIENKGRKIEEKNCNQMRFIRMMIPKIKNRIYSK